MGKLVGIGNPPWSRRSKISNAQAIPVPKSPGIPFQAVWLPATRLSVRPYTRRRDNVGSIQKFVGLWRWADRPASEAPHVDELAQSLDRDGQVAPAIVRPVRDPEQPTIRYEIIAGYVRWKAALQARRQLLVDIRPVLSDREAFSIMVVENDLRRDYRTTPARNDISALLTRTCLHRRVNWLTRWVLVMHNCPSTWGLPSYPILWWRFVGILLPSLTTGYILASLCGKGFQEQVIALLPRIEAGDIAGRQLEELAVDPSQLGRFLPTAPVSQEAAEATPSGKPESRSFVSSSGNPLFTVNISQRRAFISFVGPFRTLLKTKNFLTD